MCDLSIRLITPDVHEDRGAKAYDDGLGVNDHGLPEDSRARKHWQCGWHRQRVVRSGATFFSLPGTAGMHSLSVDSAPTGSVDVAVRQDGVASWIKEH